MARLEYKYLVPVDALPALRRNLEPFTEPDPFARNSADRTYTVRSIYFDTPGLDFYYDKIAGLEKRIKVRIRGYDLISEDRIVFLEVKRKREAFISKDCSPVMFRDVEALLATGDVDSYILNAAESIISAQSARRFLYHVHARSLRACIVVTYEREAYVNRIKHDIRITFDKSVRCGRVTGPHLVFAGMVENLVLPEHCILEVKSSRGLPLWISRLIGRFELQQQSLSKYSMCIEFQNRCFAKPTAGERRFIISQNGKDYHRHV